MVKVVGCVPAAQQVRTAVASVTQPTTLARKEYGAAIHAFLAQTSQAATASALLSRRNAVDMMEKLIPEILDEILAYVFEDISNHGELARYATVCRQWQKAVELKTLRSIELDSRDFDDFSSIFGSSFINHRRHALRTLNVTVQMPDRNYTLKHCEENNIYFRDSIVKLLRELASWEKDTEQDERVARRSSPLHLSLTWKHPSDGPGSPLRDAFLNFPSADSELELPSVSFITELYIKSDNHIPTHPAALCRILSRMPPLKKLELKLYSPSLGNRSLRLEHHRALARGVEGFMWQIPHLSELKIEDQNDYIMNHSLDQPDYTEDGVDRLSTALRRIGEAGGLTSLSLRFIPITSALFCEPRELKPGHVDESEVTSRKTWSSIRTVCIRSELALANGKWLFTGDPNVPYIAPANPDDMDEEYQWSDSPETETEDSEPGEDSPDPLPETWNVWRLTPDPTVLNPLFEDMARAATQKMPSLEQFNFHTWDHISNRNLLNFQSRFGGTQTTVALKVAEAGEMFQYDFDGPWDWLPNDYNLIPRRRFEVWHRPQWEVPERVMAMGREWAGESGTATIKKADKAFV